MVNHGDIVEILTEIGQELGYEVPVERNKKRRVIFTVTRRSGRRSDIGHDPDVVWEGSSDTAVFEVECGYRGGKQQKYLFGTITLSFLSAKAARKKTWFYIVVDNEKIRDQVFNFLHCINEHVAHTRADDFTRQILVCPKLPRNQLKSYLKKELQKEAW